MFCPNCGSSLTNDFHRCKMPRRALSREEFGMMLQGLATWHILLAPPALLVLALLLSGRPDNDPPDDFFYFDYVAAIYFLGALMVIASLLAGLVMAAVSFARLGKSFFRPNWRIILIPGLLGTLTTTAIAASTIWFITFFAWPISEMIGGFLAYQLVRRLTSSRGAVAA